jgi:pyruvate dehydrogenase (quinone)
MKSTAEAVLAGDANAWHLVVQGAKMKAQEVLPPRHQR